jgi:hypothetical protein
MNRTRDWLISTGLAVFGALTIAAAGASTGERQSGPTCLHGPDETAMEKRRRREAVTLARQIHTQEQRIRASGGVFVPLPTLSVLPSPAGFDVILVTDGVTYAFAVKDTRDPCGFAYFSDHNGLIYEGKALQ